MTEQTRAPGGSVQQPQAGATPQRAAQLLDALRCTAYPSTGVDPTAPTATGTGSGTAAPRGAGAIGRTAP